MKVLDLEVSRGKSLFKPQEIEPAPLLEIIHTISGDRDLKKKTAAVREAAKTGDAKKKKRLKGYLPFFTQSLLSERTRAGLISSRIMILDFDHVDVQILREKIMKCKSLIFAFRSPSGDGLKAVFLLSRPITDPDIYSYVYKRYARNIGKFIGVMPDMQTSDCCRGCLMAYDPNIFVNQKPNPLWLPSESDLVGLYREEYRSYFDAMEKSRGNQPEDLDEKLAEEAAEYLSDQINGYQDWLRCGMALASWGERGRRIFHILSNNPSYRDNPQDIDRKFDNLLKTPSKIGIGTLFFCAYQYGWENTKRKRSVA
jgi:hypothetical protein